MNGDTLLQRSNLMAFYASFIQVTLVLGHIEW